MKAYAALSAILLIASPAVGQSVGERSGVNSTLAAAPTTADFVKEVASSDMFEIQSSQLAALQGDAATKTFAQQMLADHGKTSSELKSIAATIPVDVPAAMLPAHQSKIDKLKGLKGADFTKQYHDDQVSAHKDAVSLFQRYAKGGDNAALKAWAGKTEPALEHHLKMAQDLVK
jgi:putative membrane protein